MASSISQFLHASDVAYTLQRIDAEQWEAALVWTAHIGRGLCTSDRRH